jgi:hypothetical protein
MMSGWLVVPLKSRCSRRPDQVGDVDRDLRLRRVGEEEHPQAVVEAVLRDALDARDLLQVGAGLLGEGGRDHAHRDDGGADDRASDASEHSDLLRSLDAGADLLSGPAIVTDPAAGPQNYSTVVAPA